MSKGIHNKHRSRVRNEILTNGIGEGTPLHKIVEALLFYSIPRKDTNEIAHKLVKKFGSLSSMLDADISELKEVDGVGDNTAALFKLIVASAKIYYTEKGQSSDRFNDMSEIYEFLKLKYLDCNKEMFSVMCFDSKGALISFDFLSSGDVAAVGISSRMIIERVIKNNAVCVILAHNHPGGNALPSIDDINTTQLIANALKSINVRLLDHIIICSDDYVSLAQSAQYCHIFK